MEVFAAVFQTLGGAVSSLRRSGGLSVTVTEVMSSIKKTDWMYAVVMACSIIGLILYL